MSRRGKKKAKPVPLSTFIGNDESPQTAPQSHYRGRRDGEVVLPQGPRASRAVDVDLSRLPTDPPFNILISNLSYDSEENSLRAHLGFIKEMGDVTWNYKEGKKDGTAFVEFHNRDGAVAALGQTDTIFGGRKIVINVAERNEDGSLNREVPWRRKDTGTRWEHDMYPQRGTWRENRGRSRYLDDNNEPGDDWRTREQSFSGRDGYHGNREHSRERFHGNREGFHSNREHSRDGFHGNREHSREGIRGNREYSREGFHSNREHSREGFHSNRERRDSSDKDSWRSMERDSSSFSSGQRFPGRRGRVHSPSSPAGDQSPEGKWSYSQGREDRRGSWRGREGGSSWRGRGDGSYQRSYDRENSNESESWRSSGPDRNERTEERDSSLTPPPPPKDREPSSAGPSIFGGAKPVDTAAREREMEDKMTRLMTSGEGTEVRAQRGDKGFREDRGYNREDRGYNREDRGYNREDRGYNREDRGYNRDHMGYKEDRRYNREDRGYNRENRDDRGYNRENRDDSGYNREDRGYNREDRGYNREDRGFNREDRGYKRGDRKERREFRGDKREYRDRRGQYRSEGAGEGDRGPRRPPEAKSAPKGVYQEQKQPEFAKNTRFSLLDSD
ncbi:hypothetical protein LOD99_15989 [Oopsacas minuta]|uniref:RRM domain-containing protein n=1 Tax=Oopsacas minuta TaxID=111878 RepID=A0AAV7K695_9METZ|nr:hypothetical protein LOD99_15989 [Oopsacas minuta]